MRIMSDTPTAALVEEALIQDALELCGTRYELEAGYKHRLLSELAHALRRTIAEREEAQRDAESYKRQTQEVSAKAIELTKEVCAKLDHAIAERDELRATVTRLNRRAQTAEAGVRDNVEACKAAGVSMGRTLANAAADMYLRRAEQAEAERDAQHEQVLRLTGELEALATKTGDVEWREDAAVEVVKMRGRQISELTATRDLLLTENAQLQQMLSRSANLVLIAENARLHERVATLELLLRGGK